MKILGLDVGDQWVGIAISDALGMFARPYKTVTAAQMIESLQDIIAAENLTTVVIGYPKTMRGTVSEQTKKIEDLKEQLTGLMPHVTWVLWDERLSSKRADALKRAKTKEEKIQSHAIAASFILSSYLEYLAMQRTLFAPQSDDEESA